MPQYRSMKTFNNRLLGLVRTGMVITMTEREMEAINRANRTGKTLVPHTGPREAPENESLPKAPHQADEPPKQPEPPGNGTPATQESSASSGAAQPGGGRGKLSSARLRARLSRRRT